VYPPGVPSRCTNVSGNNMRCHSQECNKINMSIVLLFPLGLPYSVDLLWGFFRTLGQLPHNLIIGRKDRNIGTIERKWLTSFWPRFAKCYSTGMENTYSKLNHLGQFAYLAVHSRPLTIVFVLSISDV